MADIRGPRVSVGIAGYRSIQDRNYRCLEPRRTKGNNANAEVHMRRYCQQAGNTNGHNYCNIFILLAILQLQQYKGKQKSHKMIT